MMSQPIVPPMPTCGECRALQFNPTKPHKLCCFFNDLDFQFTQLQVVDDKEMKEHALWFISCDTMELWEILPEFANMTAPYQKFVNTVYQLYPGSNVEQHWLIADMDKLVGETLRTGISSLASLGKYYRDFITITTFLIAKNHLAAPEQSCAFTHGLPPELWSQVSYQLQLKFPDHFPNDLNTLEQIHDTMCFVLHSTVASAPMLDYSHACTLTIMPAIKTKFTELSMLIDTMKQFVAMLNTQSKPSTPTDLLMASVQPALPVAML